MKDERWKMEDGRWKMKEEVYSYPEFMSGKLTKFTYPIPCVL
jgi:hypothetical protein